jgi:nucleolar complex protein 2
VLAAYPRQEQLQHLVFPLTQIIEGIISLQPSAKFFPLRLQFVSMLNQLAAKSGVFINSSTYVLEIFGGSNDIGKKITQSKLKMFDAVNNLKVPKKNLTAKVAQDAIFNLAYEYLLEWLGTYSGSIAFPEVVLPAQLTLKKFVKSCKLSYMRRQIQQLLDKILLNVKFIQAKRVNAKFSAKDVSQVRFV